MADKLFVKLGPKARNFWCPITETQVLPGNTVEIVGKLSWLIKGAINGGHLVVVTEEELLQAKPLSKMTKAELIAHFTPSLTEEELPKFSELTKPKMVAVINNFTGFETTLEDLTDLTPEELDTKAKETLDDEDYTDYAESENKVETLKSLLPNYFDPFLDI